MANLFVNAGNSLLAYNATTWPPTLEVTDSDVDATSDDSPTGLTRTVYRGGWANRDTGAVFAGQEPISYPANARGFGAYYPTGVGGSKDADWGSGQLLANGTPINASTVAWIAPHKYEFGTETPANRIFVALTQAQQHDENGYAHLLSVDPVSGLVVELWDVDSSAATFQFKNALSCYDEVTGRIYYVRGNNTTLHTNTDYQVFCLDPAFGGGGGGFVASAASLGDPNFFPDSLGGRLDADGNICAIGNGGRITIFTPAGSLVWMEYPSSVFDQVFDFNDAAQLAGTPAFANAYEPSGSLDHMAVAPDGQHLLVLGERRDVSGATPTATYGTARARAGEFDMAIWRWSIADRQLVNEEPLAIQGFTNGMASSPVPSRAQAIWTSAVATTGGGAVPDLAGSLRGRRADFGRGRL